MLIWWLAVPFVAWVGGRTVIRAQKRQAATRQPVDPVQRLEFLRRRRDEEPVALRGRMAEALRLAEAAGPLRTEQR